MKFSKFEQNDKVQRPPLKPYAQSSKHTHSKIVKISQNYKRVGGKALVSSHNHDENSDKLSIYAIPPFIDEMQIVTKHSAPKKVPHKHRVLKSYTKNEQVSQTEEFDDVLDQAEVFKKRVIKACMMSTDTYFYKTKTTSTTGDSKNVSSFLGSMSNSNKSKLNVKNKSMEIHKFNMNQPIKPNKIAENREILRHTKGKLATLIKPMNYYADGELKRFEKTVVSQTRTSTIDKQNILNENSVHANITQIHSAIKPERNLSTIQSMNEDTKPYPTVTLSYKAQNDADVNSIYDVKRNPRLNRFNKQIMNFKSLNKFSRKEKVKKRMTHTESFTRSRQHLRTKEMTHSSNESEEHLNLTIVKHSESLDHTAQRLKANSTKRMGWTVKNRSTANISSKSGNKSGAIIQSDKYMPMRIQT